MDTSTSPVAIGLAANLLIDGDTGTLNRIGATPALSVITVVKSQCLPHAAAAGRIERHVTGRSADLARSHRQHMQVSSRSASTLSSSHVNPRQWRRVIVGEDRKSKRGRAQE
jgi:hypothetical protein